MPHLVLAPLQHEVGHNLGLGHSNEDGQPYADWTGYMASGLPDHDKPKKCFNAANHAQLEWFQDRIRTWKKEEGSRLVKLAGFVHYAQTTVGEPVILQFGRFYGQYNLAVKHNEGTEEYANEFVLVEQVDGATELRTHLAVGQSVRISGTSIFICGTVDSQPQSLLVGIGSVPLAESGNLCGLPVENIASQPTDPPTRQPTDPPTRRPTEKPTLQPTKKPTEKPTPQPTDEPTDKPTKAPTPEPTGNPTKAPTTIKPTPALGGESDTTSTSAPTTSIQGEESGYEGGSGSSLAAKPPPSVSSTEAPTQPRSASDPSVSSTEVPTGPRSASGVMVETAAPTLGLDQDEEGTDLVSVSQEPSTKPSQEPTAEQSSEPSSEPSSKPSHTPSEKPSETPSDTPSDPVPTLPPTKTVIETNAPVVGVEVNPDGTTASASVKAEDDDDDSRKASNKFLQAWEKLAVGSTWFEYFR